jgi:hypothetical protein
MRTRTLWPSILGLIWIAVLPPAQAQDPDSTADVRCILVGFRLGQMPDQTQRSSGMMLALYYIGRLDGREPQLDIEKLVVEQLASMTSADYASEAVRCGNSLTTKGQQITRIGQNLIKRGQAMQKPKSTPSD